MGVLAVIDIKLTSRLQMVSGSRVDVSDVSSTTSGDSTAFRRGPIPGVGYTTSSSHTLSEGELSTHTQRVDRKPVVPSHTNEGTAGGARTKKFKKCAPKQRTPKKR